MADENQVKEEKKDSYITELVNKATKENNNLSQEEIKKIIAETSQSTEFLTKLEDIDVGDDSYRVIFTDGQEQLLYDDGEFFEISTTDATVQKRKIGKQEARDKYIEYFIKYVLNPMIKKREQEQISRRVERYIQPEPVSRNTKLKRSNEEPKAR